MKRFVVLLMAGLLAVGFAACGDDDGDVAVTGEVPPEETAAPADDGTAPDDSDSGDEGTDTSTDTGDDADAEGGDGVPRSDDICAAIEPALESVYGAPTETEAGDGTYPSCSVDFDAARVVVSAFALDDPLVGGDFDAYIDEVGDTVDGLEPVEGIGDQAVANDTGNAYVLLGENVITVTRVFNGEVGDRSDITDVAEAVAGALALTS